MQEFCDSCIFCAENVSTLLPIIISVQVINFTKSEARKDKNLQRGDIITERINSYREDSQLQKGMELRREKRFTEGMRIYRKDRNLQRG